MSNNAFSMFGSAVEPNSNSRGSPSCASKGAPCRPLALEVEAKVLEFARRCFLAEKVDIKTEEMGIGVIHRKDESVRTAGRTGQYAC